MLKTMKHDQIRVTTFVLEGKLVGPWVEVLTDHWQALSSAHTGQGLVVNLAGVTTMDA